ncbi:glycosyltransferase family 4 protein [Sphingomonas sp. NBWT7]|uniref:glycosyltransferase family 4 protein n=1 Tax=Sphingomonas sp. NBWT7 TaxID=2596913 RepID=UPI001623F047|nr:glycosyltransferase family 4 protein [Sphingomonas sp. NBWT7]QNE31045.1 glycosyltransferase family 4 protein [Sphingomonas sp. NBWT7]
MLILGGSVHHPGGLEAFCERAVAAINAHGHRWRAEWRTTDNAYLTARRLPRAFKRLMQSFWLARRYDVVWLQWSTLADLLFVIAMRVRRVPVIVTPHLGGNARLQRVRILRDAARRLLGLADRLALLFAAQAEELSLPRDVPKVTVRSFLPQAALQVGGAGARSGALRIIHAGRLSEAKGSFRAIALCAALHTHGYPVSATIVGRADPATMRQLHDAADQAGLRQSIDFVEWLDETRLIAAYEQSDVLVHLSMIDSYPLVVLEAMARGVVPVVGPMAGAASMVAQYGGYVAEDPMVEAAATWILQRPVQQLREYGTSIAAFVRADFAWNVCGERIIALAEEVRGSTAAHVPLKRRDVA